MLRERFAPGLVSAYSVPVLSTGMLVVAAEAARLLLPPGPPGHISGPLFVLPPVVSAWYGGLGPALVGAGLSFFSLEFFFLPPVFEFGLGWNDLPRAGVFLAVSLAVSMLVARRDVAEETLRSRELGLGAAARIQEHLFPKESPCFDNFDIAGHSYPADATGGDYFDFVPLSNGRLGIALGDVSGHGFASALLMAETRACLRTLALTHCEPQTILTLANRLLVGDINEDRFITLLFVSVDPRTREVEYAGAGHEGYLLSPNGTMTRVPSTGLALGIDPENEVPSISLRLSDGDLMLLISDGVFETHSPDDVMFGLERVKQVVHSHHHQPATQIVDALMRSLRDFSGNGALQDDVTIVVVKANPVK